MCSWIVFDSQLYIWCYYLHLVVRWFNIANPFYFNLSEVFFNLDQERKLHAINCVLFFAKVFISSLNSEQQTLETIWVIHYISNSLQLLNQVIKQNFKRLVISTTGRFIDWKLQTDIWVIHYIKQNFWNAFLCLVIILQWIKDNVLQKLGRVHCPVVVDWIG